MNKLRIFWNFLKPFIKPWLIVMAIYCFAMLAVWRSGVSFVDDRGRAFYGYAWTSDFHRYSSTLLGLALNVNDRLLDISPWPQILAMGLMSTVSVIITYIFCDRKIKYLPLILSAFIGLQPFIIECWLYKFDAPCIALAIFASVLPIAFWPKEWHRREIWRFTLISALGILVMWTSYQAASGIFPLLCLYMALRERLSSRKWIRSSWLILVKKLAIAVAAYLVPTLIFRFCFPSINGYRNTDMLPLGDLIPGIFRNLSAYFSFIIENLNLWWKILISLGLVGIVVLIIYRYRVKSLWILAAFVIAVPLSFGAYLILAEPSLNARSLLALGMLFVPLIILATQNLNRIWQYICTAPSLIFLYACAIFVLALGNGLADQERWANFRVEYLLADLAELYPDYTEVADSTIQINGDIGYSAVMAHVVSQYPLATNIVTYQQRGLTQGTWGITKLRSYYNRQQNFQVVDENPEICQTMHTVKLDTYYHTIKDDGATYICVDIK